MGVLEDINNFDELRRHYKNDVHPAGRGSIHYCRRNTFLKAVWCWMLGVCETQASTFGNAGTTDKLKISLRDNKLADSIEVDS